MNKNIFNNSTLNALRTLDDSPAMRAIRAIEDSPSMRMIRNINYSPALKMMREIENSPTMQMLRQVEESPAMRIVRDFENLPALKTINDLEKSIAFKAIRDLQDSPALRAIKALEVSPSIKAFSKVADQLKHIYGALAFSEAYELLIDEIPEIEDDDSWEALSEKVQDRTSRSPLSPLSAEFYLSLIFALFLYYLSQMSATESEERMLERMNELEQTITTQLNSLQSNDTDYVFSVPDRELNLREGPSMDHQVIEVLPMNKKVMELERNRDWVKIEYFDYLNNISKVGWVHSKYLLVLDL